MKKLSLAFIAAGLCAVLPACSMTDAEKAQVKADVKAAATAAAPSVKQAVSDYAKGDTDAVKSDLEQAGKAAASALSTSATVDSASMN